ncbi:MAG: IS1595 family transposase [Bacteroidales bacterium]|jgi:transposase-like protein|nr:IS1595 family transposase [Bacteroidales bacterium]
MKNLIEFNSLLDLLQAFPTEQSCIEALEQIRWTNGVVSPYDSSSKVYCYNDGRYRCANTGKDFSVRTGTLFHATRVSLQKWFVAIWLLTTNKKGISSYCLAKQLHVTQPTAWFMLHRMRKCFNMDTGKLSGEVELDETFVGGKNKNRHANKKVRNSQGRSFKDKTPIFGMLERKGYVRTFVVPDTTHKSLTPIIFNNIEKQTTLYSDEWCGYKLIKQYPKYYTHLQVDHGKGQYVNGDATTNSIEGFWSILKRGIIGVYHHASRKYLQLYANEYTFRYNTRKQSDSDRFYLFLTNINKGNRLTYKTLING